jgi:hypothetical protein
VIPVTKKLLSDSDAYAKQAIGRAVMRAAFIGVKATNE